MICTHKIALDPNAEQERYFRRSAGIARFAWNWALAEWIRQRDAGEKPSEARLRKQLNSIKRDQFPWMYDVSKCVVQEAIINLGAAFEAFFTKKSRYPRFKSRDNRRSFCAASEAGKFRAVGKAIKLPKIGVVRMREAVRFSGTLKRVVVCEEGGRWFASILIEADSIQKPERPNESCVGIDLGVRKLAVVSTGEIITGPNAHKSSLVKLRRASKSVSRKKKGSANRAKARARVAKIHRRIVNQRQDAIHKFTTRMVVAHSTICIENLNVRGMITNQRQARAVSDQGFYEIRRQLEYKAQWYGSRIVLADRRFPSSKTCSCCGVIAMTLGRSQIVFRCDSCGATLDRDLNAARNLEKLAASSAVTACGEGRSDARRRPRVKRLSMKQEEVPRAAFDAVPLSSERLADHRPLNRGEAND